MTLKLTVEQALQEATSALNDGKFKEAEHLFRDILKDQKKNPYINHYLGVTLYELNKLEEAEIYYDKAIKCKPDFAAAHYNLGVTLKKQGRLKEAEISYQKAIELEAEISITYSNDQKLGQAIESISSGNPQEAEIFYREILEKQPMHPYAHQNLAVCLQQLGRLEEAEISYKKAIEFKPNMAEAHNNLGNLVKQLGRLEEAEISYKKAIELKSTDGLFYKNLADTLKQNGKFEEAIENYKTAVYFQPKYPKAYNNLGVLLKRVEKIDEAELAYKKALELKPNFAEAHYNLGNMLRDVNRPEEAEKSYKKAIKFKSNFIEAYYNLGNIQLEMGVLEEAETNYIKAITLKPNDAELWMNLSIAQDYLNKLDLATLQLEHILEMKKDNWRLKAAVNLSIIKFLENDFLKSKKYLLESQKIHEKENFEFQNFKKYHDYLLKILNQHKNQSLENLNVLSDNKLYVIGESHALVSHGLHFKTSKNDFVCKSMFIMGCKQWHLGSIKKNRYKTKFENIISSLSKYSEILLSIGEIDCRLNDGIIKHNNKYPEKKRIDLINITIDNYLNYILKINSNYQHKITIQGIPSPNIDITDTPKEKVEELISLVKDFNIVLKNKSIKIGFGFLDLYELTNRGDGFSNKIWHLDAHHLSTKGMLEALHIHYN